VNARGLGVGVGQAQVGARGFGVGESAPCGCPHKKLVPTDIILSSSHAKNFAFFCTRISFSNGIKSGNFLSI